MNFKKVIEIYLILVFTVLMVLFVIVGNQAFGSTFPQHCNQKLYDSIYKFITREALADGLRAKTEGQQRRVSLKRFNEIISLRELCNGQLSSYERGK